MIINNLSFSTPSPMIVQLYFSNHSLYCVPWLPYENSDSSCHFSAGLNCGLPTVLLLTHTHGHARESAMAESKPSWCCSVPSHLERSQSRSQNRPRRKSSLLFYIPWVINYFEICIPFCPAPQSTLLSLVLSLSLSASHGILESSVNLFIPLQ